MNLKWRISHVRGYLELGMVKEAKAELDAVPAAEARRPEVVALRVAMLQATEKWRPLRKLCDEDACQFVVTTGGTGPAPRDVTPEATRRAASVRAAEKILLQAEEKHPKEATIQFNLGCYACLMGDLSTAKARVVRAIALDRDYLKNARDDPDLQPLRDAEPDWMDEAKAL